MFAVWYGGFAVGDSVNDLSALTSLALSGKPKSKLQY